MGCRFEQAADPQQMASLTYPEDTRTRLGRRQDLQFGRKHFYTGAVQTLANGKLVFENTTGDLPNLEDKRPGTAPLPSRLRTIPPPKNEPAPMRQAT